MKIHKIAKVNDYKFVSGVFILGGEFLAIPGCVCDDPTEGAKLYNHSLIKYVEAKSDDRERLRYQEILKRFKRNRRVIAVLDCLESSRPNLGYLSLFQQRLFFSAMEDFEFVFHSPE